MKILNVLACAAALALAVTGCGGSGGGASGGGAQGYATATGTTPDSEAKPVPVAGCSVEFYGDSIMAGNGTSETPVMVLQRLRPGLQVIADHSVPGTKLSMLYPDFAASPRAARYVVIENGVIDAWQAAPIAYFLKTYSDIVERIRSEGRVPVLTGFSRQALGGVLRLEDILRRDSYDAALKAYATEAGVAFSDWGAVRFDGPSDLSDFVHPNRTYSDRLVAQLALTLDEVTHDCDSAVDGDSVEGA